METKQYAGFKDDAEFDVVNEWIKANGLDPLVICDGPYRLRVNGDAIQYTSIVVDDSPEAVAGFEKSGVPWSKMNDDGTDILRVDLTAPLKVDPPAAVVEWMERV